MTLTKLAKRAHPENRRHQAKFVLAARWLRQRNAWVIDPGSKKPAWAHQTEIQ